jgi:hypothetical protein
MDGMHRVVVAGILCAGCLGSRTQPCSSGSDSWICPADQLCAAPPTYCGSSTLVDACDGKAQFDACEHSPTDTGACIGGVCTMCAVDIEGCHYDGWTAMTSNTTVDLDAIWVAARGDAYAGGANGTLLHYDGKAWMPASFPALPSNPSIVALSGTATDDVFALTSNSVVEHFDGTTWSDITPIPSVALKGLWSDATGKAVVVGPTGEIERYDGASWSESNVSPVGLNAVGGASSNDMFAVGNNGAVEHFTGTWAGEAAATIFKLQGVWTDGTTAFAVGVRNSGSTMPTILIRAPTWTTMTLTAPVVDLASVWGISSTDVYTVGRMGVIIHYDGATWTATSTSGSHDLASVHAHGNADVFAVGLGGTILRLTP